MRPAGWARPTRTTGPRRGRGERGAATLPVLRDEPKNAASVRTITLPAEAVAALRAQRTLQATARLRAPRWEDAGGKHGGLVFASARGTPRSRTNVRRGLVADAQAAGVALPPRQAIHVLRHTFASSLLAAGRPITEVAHLLGHSSARVTLEVYGHFVREDTGAAAEAMAPAWLGAFRPHHSHSGPPSSSAPSAFSRASARERAASSSGVGLDMALSTSSPSRMYSR